MGPDWQVKMMRWIGALACALPFLEIAGFVWIGSKLGVALTLAWVLGAMVAGLLLLRRTGMQAVGKLRAALEKGSEPGHSMLDSACFTAAAMLLIVPGFFSDALAALLMLPITRAWLLRRTAAHFETRVYRQGGRQGGVIHGDFTVVPEAGEAGEDERGPQTPRKIGPGSDPGGSNPGGGRPVIDVD